MTMSKSTKPEMNPSLTQEEKRVRIAEACGWRCLAGHDWIAPGDAFETRNTQPLPDYFTDLDACHEMEKILTPEQCWLMSKELDKLCGVAGGLGSGTVDEHTWHATAAQRAEAFGRTLNLWNE